MRARRKLVDQARHHFFSGAAFSQHQHRNINVGHQRSLRTQLAHVGAGGYEENLVAEFFDFAGVVFLVGAEALVNDFIQLGLLKWLGDVVGRTQADGLHHFLGVVDAGQHHHFYAGLQLAQVLQRFQSVDSRA